MPPKQKESAAIPAASGPKHKRSKTSFQTPTTAALERTTSAESEVGSTSTISKNRVVTLRASASGRRGYHSQDLSTTQSTSHEYLAADNSSIPSEITGDSDITDISDLNPESSTSRSRERYPTWFSYKVKVKKEEYNNSRLHGHRQGFILLIII